MLCEPEDASCSPGRSKNGTGSFSLIQRAASRGTCTYATASAVLSASRALISSMEAGTSSYTGYRRLRMS